MGTRSRDHRGWGADRMICRWGKGAVSLMYRASTVTGWRHTAHLVAQAAAHDAPEVHALPEVRALLEDVGLGVEDGLLLLCAGPKPRVTSLAMGGHT
jgi:hypothetical protein